MSARRLPGYVAYLVSDLDVGRRVERYGCMRCGASGFCRSRVRDGREVVARWLRVERLRGPCRRALDLPARSRYFPPRLAVSLRTVFALRLLTRSELRSTDYR